MARCQVEAAARGTISSILHVAGSDGRFPGNVLLTGWVSSPTARREWDRGYSSLCWLSTEREYLRIYTVSASTSSIPPSKNKKKLKNHNRLIFLHKRRANGKLWCVTLKDLGQASDWFLLEFLRSGRINRNKEVTHRTAAWLAAHRRGYEPWRSCGEKARSGFMQIKKSEIHKSYLIIGPSALPLHQLVILVHEDEVT